MEIIKLKNGSEELKVFVVVCFNTIKFLFEREPLAFCELVEKARNEDHQFLGNSKNILSKLELIKSDGSLHQSVKNVVLSSVDGKGLNMTLLSPFA